MELHFSISTLYAQLQSQTLLDVFITVTALLYVWLAAIEKPACWAWGMVSCSLWAYADFFRYNLWVDGILQLFYVGIACWGLYSWKFGGKESRGLAIITLPGKLHAGIFLAGLAMTLLLGYIFGKYTPTALPYPDSFVTAFSILATFLTVRKVLENWLYWIVVDMLAVFLFLAREAVLVALVMAVYTVISVFGYVRWRRQYRQSLEKDNIQDCPL